MENKNLYESVLILKGTFTQEEYTKSLNQIIEKIKNLVEITKIEEIGAKKLAYQVQDNKIGYYIIIEFKATSQKVLELERFYRIEDDILKFIVVRKED